MARPPRRPPRRPVAFELIHADATGRRVVSSHATREEALRARPATGPYFVDVIYEEETRSGIPELDARAARYGLTTPDLERLLARGRCDACGLALEPGEGHVDHDHACCDRSGSCGRCVRGLLCPTCNLALGMIQDDPKRLLALVAYLARANS